ncbi:MAG TPA: GNAT family N-acetyltransferase [Firmicutes bacterium]|nr:GNAT family N-acetyltransferase [Bacillota bacterium]
MLKIREFKQSDQERILEITVESFDGVSIDQNIERLWGRIEGKSWQWRKKQSIIDDLNANPAGVFVAEEEGKVVGYVTTRVEEETGIGRIPNMAVDARHRGKGIGKKLLQEAMEYLKAAGMKYARIETLEQNTIGREFYPRMGFKEVARQIHYAKPLS